MRSILANKQTFNEFNRELSSYSIEEVTAIMTNMLDEVVRKKAAKNDPIRNEKKRNLLDFKTFINTYFSHYITSDFGDCQNQLISDIEKFRNRSARKPIRMTRAMPRGFGKSSIVTLFGVFWLILNGDHKFVIILSSNANTASGFLAAIIDEVETNERLTDDFPELLPGKDFKGQTVAWRDSEIVFANGVRIMSLGWLNSVRGLRKKNHRPDLIICDDPDEEKDVSSDTKMERKYRWFDRAVLRLGGIHGVDVFVNYTTIAENCVGEYIFKNNQKYYDWDRRKYKAIEKDADGNEYSTWANAFPLAVLQEEREKDPLGFATEKQNEPLPETDQKFKGLIQVYSYPPTSDYTGWKLSLACDLSLGRNERSDYSAIIGVAMAPDGIMYQILEDVQRRKPDQIERDFLSALQMFKWNIAGVETSGNQAYFLGENERSGLKRTIAEYNRKSTQKILCPVVGIDSTGDKIKRIEGRLQKLIANGLLRLRDDSVLLWKQLDDFPHNYLDAPDALDMAVGLLTEGNFVKVSAVKVSKTTPGLDDIRRQRFEKMGVDYNAIKRNMKG